MENILTVENLEKIYKNKRGIFDINFKIDEGQVIGLLGPNGSGKTTIMKAITGLLYTKKGNVTICGASLENDFEEAIKNVGCLIETPTSLTYMTPYENLKYISRYYKDISVSRIEEVLDIVGLTKYKDEKVKKFSLGMKQRLSIAIAIYQNPKLVILDEPANGLDIQGTAELRGLISRLSKEFLVSFLVSSHLIHEVELVCDKILIIKDGRIIDTCNVNDVINKGIVLENYFLEKVNNQYSPL